MSTPTLDPKNTPIGAPVRRNKTLTIILSVIGGLILLGLIAGGIGNGLSALGRTNATLTANADGATALDVEAHAGQVTVQFADVPEAQLEVIAARSQWELKREGDVLIVNAPDRWWGDWCFFDCNDERTQVTLSLPQALNDGSLNADLELAAGQFTATGNFNDLVTDMSAGDLRIEGTAKTADIQLGAGRAQLELTDVHSASFEVSAGRMDVVLTGQAPDSVQGEVSAGFMDLTLPDAAYDVRSNVSAGDLVNNLQVESGSKHLVQLDVSAGNAVLNSGR